MTEQERTPLLDFALLLAEHHRVLIAVPALVALAAFALTFLAPRSYTGVSKVLVEVPAGANVNAYAEQYVALLRSRTVHDSVIKRHDLAAVYGADKPDQARSELEKRTRIWRNQAIVSIEAEDHDPRRAAEIANAFVGELVALVRTLAFAPASQRRVYFEGQLAQVKNRLAAAQAELRAAGASEARIKKLAQSRDDMLAKLSAQVAFQEMRLAAETRLAATHGQAHGQTNAAFEYRLLVQEMATLGAQLARMQETGGKPGASEYGPAYRQFKTYRLLHDLVQEQHNLAKVEEDRVVQFVEKAVPPLNESGPRRVLVAAEAGLAALVAVLCIVLFRRVVRARSPARR